MSTTEKIYSLSQCPFCNSKLQTKYTCYCDNQDCSYQYESYPGGIVDFLVGSYIVEIHLDPPQTKILGDKHGGYAEPIVEIDNVFWIDNYNYTEVIDRLKKLKVFA